MAEFQLVTRDIESLAPVIGYQVYHMGMLQCSESFASPHNAGSLIRSSFYLAVNFAVLERPGQLRRLAKESFVEEPKGNFWRSAVHVVRVASRHGASGVLPCWLTISLTSPAEVSVCTPGAKPPEVSPIPQGSGVIRSLCKLQALSSARSLSFGCLRGKFCLG